jgi:hypothetical protein
MTTNRCASRDVLKFSKAVGWKSELPVLSDSDIVRRSGYDVMIFSEGTT